MQNYIKPAAFPSEGMSEGIYMASGEVADNTSSSGGKEEKRGCKSKYMKGVFQKPTYQPIKDGYKIGRGCEGCPAWNGNSCRFETAPEEMNWDGDFRPSWEVAGHLPDEKGY